MLSRSPTPPIAVFREIIMFSVTFLQGENTNSLWQGLIQVYALTLAACSL